MNDIIKNIKSLEDSGVLIDGVTETVRHKIRKRISWSFVSTFSCFNSSTKYFLVVKGIGRRIVRRVERGYMKKMF